jgi:L,D-transpeptidase YbiS
MLEIQVQVSLQKLNIFDNGFLAQSYNISTAQKGVGEQNGSQQTPRGLHIIRAKIGSGLPCNTVFVSRRSTGEIYSEALGRAYPNRDWILTRILWLSGCEPRFNRLGQCDTMRRYIYIHGCPDEYPMGFPFSHGCIRMRNVDIIELFERVQIGAQVNIVE